MSQKLDRSLSLSERIALKLHLTVCSGCRNFENNMEFLRKACRRATENTIKD